MVPPLRPPRLEEATALHALMVEVQRHDDLPLLAHEDEVTDLFAAPNIDSDLDIAVVELDGDLIAYGYVGHAESGERLERAVLAGGVHPSHRRQGIGHQIITWQMQRAEQQLALTAAHLPAHEMVYVYDFEEARIAMLESLGFTRARFDHELLRSLTELPERQDIDGIEIRPWLPTDTEATRQVFNASFADHWGSTPQSAASWAHELDSASARTDLSFVAVDRASGEIVAITLNAHYPDDRLVTGRLDGWVQSLGTIRSHRKRGIASALVIHSLHAFAAAGFDHAMLGVDTENPSGAYGIYADLGFEKQHTMVTMMATVRSGATG